MLCGKLGQPIVLPLRPKQKWCFVVNYWGGEKLGRPILSPPWKVKALTLCRWLSEWKKTGPAHSFPTPTSENINHTLSWICKQSLLFRGGEKLGRPILSPPQQDKISTMCRWLSGWRKTWLVHYFPTLTSESINLTLSWIHILPLLIRGWGKTGPAQSFHTLTSESINLVQKLGYLGGEKLGRPILSPPQLVKVSTLPSHEYANSLCFLGGGEKLGHPILSPSRQDKASTLCRWLSGWRKTRLVRYFPTLTSESIDLTLSWIHILPLLIREWGKTGPAQSFPTLTSESINLVQKLGYLGGEKLGRPILSLPQLVKVSTLPSHEYANNLCFLGGGEKLGRPILSPPRQDKASTLCRWLSGWRKTRLVRYFPTLRSERINPYLSWICKQPLLFRGWGKTGLAHSFPILTSESINLVQKLGYLGGEKLGWSVTFPPWQVKASTLPCHEHANNLCFLGGGEKLGWPILSPPWLV